jgi:hypothetical protein
MCVYDFCWRVNMFESELSDKVEREQMMKEKIMRRDERRKERNVLF